MEILENPLRALLVTSTPIGIRWLKFEEEPSRAMFDSSTYNISYYLQLYNTMNMYDHCDVISEEIMLPSGPQADEFMAEFREALANHDKGRALYLVVKKLAGDPLTEELPICDESGRAVGYLLPPKERYALCTADEFRAMQEEVGIHAARIGESREGWSR